MTSISLKSVGKFRYIGVGVLHPEKENCFLAGVECAGVAYHSSDTDRKRDAVRQDWLEKKGWTILRVFSTDWRRNKTAEAKKLNKKLKLLLEA